MTTVVTLSGTGRTYDVYHALAFDQSNRNDDEWIATSPRSGHTLLPLPFPLLRFQALPSRRTLSAQSLARG
jgi:hypothetical protein